MAENVTFKRCGKRKNCSKLANHQSKCDAKYTANQSFWKYSPIQQQLHSDNLSQKIRVLSQLNEIKVSQTEQLIDDIVKLKEDKNVIQQSVDAALNKQAEIEKELNVLNTQYEKVKLLIDQKQYARTKRSKNPTTDIMINDTACSTKYRRRDESRNIMEFIHGGSDGAIYGAWDLLCYITPIKLMEQFTANYKRGKFLENLCGSISNSYVKSKTGLNKAVALKYINFLSQRKYNMICKVQKSTFSDNFSNISSVNSVQYGNVNYELNMSNVSNANIEKFVKSLDIGEIHQIPGYSGVSRTVTALVTMIADLNLKVKVLNEKLVWFNGNINHFVVEFSDDGAPESQEKTMTIGTLSMWNFGNRIRSREFHYPLHMITASEKDKVCELLWKQHSEEMELIESNVFNINNIKTTFEFVPSADISWLCFAANVLPTSATYPSPFANVHKSELTHRNKTIGGAEATWQVPTMDTRLKELTILKKFENTQNVNASESARHSEKLNFMAENGIRQLGEPHIGKFADLIRPEPLHLEINNWQHVLDLIYKESVRRGVFDQFIDALSNPPKESDELGCGLKFLAKNIRKHYENESKKLNKLETRLIGAQAIALAQYSFRLVDILQVANESSIEKLKRAALAKICESLRDAGVLINKFNFTSENYPAEVSKYCSTYFKLFSLFFPESCQSTVWTMGYVVPYHALEIYKKYHVGYGVLSMQGKESSHSSIKQQLRNNTNRSVSYDEQGKWHQLMRSNFVRNFYLPYHFPINITYHSHYKSRVPADLNSESICHCSRQLITEQLCECCIFAVPLMQCVEKGELTEDVLAILKPYLCQICNEQFADKNKLFKHLTAHTNKQVVNIIPRDLSLKQLKDELRLRSKSISGNKTELTRRLEGFLTK
ncbi:uncharacterized protein LOC124818342 [Hydra vulgaris]|uniref:uncharacterized protein LOC124818342 n=1 Tax=Hydra vulgaris TaxID=6087 RepID=UPI001F5FDAF8|nr:uncharacterized protein LOC124818342 [Hydra vulgaris]